MRIPANQAHVWPWFPAERSAGASSEPMPADLSRVRHRVGLDSVDDTGPERTKVSHFPVVVPARGAYLLPAFGIETAAAAVLSRPHARHRAGAACVLHTHVPASPVGGQSQQERALRCSKAPRFEDTTLDAHHADQGELVAQDPPVDELVFEGLPSTEWVSARLRRRRGRTPTICRPAVLPLIVIPTAICVGLRHSPWIKDTTNATVSASRTTSASVRPMVQKKSSRRRRIRSRWAFARRAWAGVNSLLFGCLTDVILPVDRPRSTGSGSGASARVLENHAVSMSGVA